MTHLNLNISGYEGPLDVLLELSRKQKVDIKKISILELANQYLKFVEENLNNLKLSADKMSNPISEKWEEIKTLVESIELDVAKNAAGNNSAGIRARKGLRILKKEAADLVKLTVAEEKARKAK